MPNVSPRFKNYEARYAERESASIRDAASSVTETRPPSSDGSESSLDPEMGKQKKKAASKAQTNEIIDPP